MIWYPQNSSTLLKVMTSFNKSAHDSFGPVAVGVFVNHNVQVCIRGCLTLKFLGSWKTVNGSFNEKDAGESDWVESRESLSIASVGGAGERTSVILRVLRLDANGCEIAGRWRGDGVAETTLERQMRKFWRWVSKSQKGETIAELFFGWDWNCMGAWIC